MIASRFVRAVLKALRFCQKRMVLPAKHHTLAASSTGTQRLILGTTVNQPRANRAWKVKIVARHAFIAPVGFTRLVIRLVIHALFITVKRKIGGRIENACGVRSTTWAFLFHAPVIAYKILMSKQHSVTFFAVIQYLNSTYFNFFSQTCATPGRRIFALWEGCHHRSLASAAEL